MELPIDPENYPGTDEYNELQQQRKRLIEERELVAYENEFEY